MWSCTVDPRDLPDEGENDAGVPWSDIKEVFKEFCGFDEDSLDEDGGFANMSPDELDDWADHECADKKSVNPERVRERVRIPMTTHPREWDREGVDPHEVDDPEEMGVLEMAQKANSYNARGYGSWQNYGPYDDYDETECPSGWGIANLNWAQDPEREYAGEYYDIDRDSRDEYTELRGELS